MDGHRWVEHLLGNLPGGQLGFLIVVNLLIFVLAFFLDFFELAFIIVPLLAPVADKLGIDLIWFGVLLGVNMQTSFMHPPFGFALFFLRSVAPASVKTSDIYWGAIPFVVIQIIMIGLVIAFPQMVSAGLDKEHQVRRQLGTDRDPCLRIRLGTAIRPWDGYRNGNTGQPETGANTPPFLFGPENARLTLATKHEIRVRTFRHTEPGILFVGKLL